MQSRDIAILEESFLRNPTFDPNKFPPGSFLCEISRNSVEYEPITCPRDGCGGTIIKKKSGRGTEFYGCSNYGAVNNCAVAFWEAPLQEKCPQCASVMVSLTSSASEKTIQCSNKKCGFSKPFANSSIETAAQIQPKSLAPQSAIETYDRLRAAGYRDAAVLVLPISGSNAFCVYFCWEGELLVVACFNSNGDLTGCCRIDPTFPQIVWVSQAELLAEIPGFPLLS